MIGNNVAGTEGQHSQGQGDYIVDRGGVDQHWLKLTSN